MNGDCWGIFTAISPRSVKSYSHLGEIKDISVRGSWQGLSTARVVSGFWFPIWIPGWGEHYSGRLAPTSRCWKCLNTWGAVGLCRGAHAAPPAPQGSSCCKAAGASVGHEPSVGQQRVSPPCLAGAAATIQQPGVSMLPAPGLLRARCARLGVEKSLPLLGPLGGCSWAGTDGESVLGSGVSLGVLACSRGAAKSMLGSVGLGGNRGKSLSGMALLPGCAPGAGPVPAGCSRLQQPLHAALLGCFKLL